MISPPSGTLRVGLYGAGPQSRAILMPCLAGLDHGLEAVCDPRADLADDFSADSLVATTLDLDEGWHAVLIEEQMVHGPAATAALLGRHRLLL